MILVGVLLKKKTKSAQHRWWREHRIQFERWLGRVKFPGRTTYFDRYRRAHRLFQTAIVLLGRQAVAAGWADARCVAADKSLIAGRGRRWNSTLRRRGRVPRRVDRDTTWGYSQHDGWVQGYSFEVIVTAPKKGVSWPLAASVDTASRAEQKTLVEKIPHFPSRHAMSWRMRVTTVTRSARRWSGTERVARNGAGCARRSAGRTRAKSANRTTGRHANGNGDAACVTSAAASGNRRVVDRSTAAARRASSRSTRN